MFMGTQMRHQTRKKNFLSLSFALAMACHILAGVAVHADQVRLKDGRHFDADEVWELGNDIWYRQGKVINSIEKNAIARILRGTPEQVEAQLSAEAAATDASRLRARPPAYAGGNKSFGRDHHGPAREIPPIQPDLRPSDRPVSNQRLRGAFVPVWR